MGLCCCPHGRKRRGGRSLPVGVSGGAQIQLTRFSLSGLHGTPQWTQTGEPEVLEAVETPDAFIVCFRSGHHERLPKLRDGEHTVSWSECFGRWPRRKLLYEVVESALE